jgi:hypothetical protein
MRVRQCFFRKPAKEESLPITDTELSFSILCQRPIVEMVHDCFRVEYHLVALSGKTERELLILVTQEGTVEPSFSRNTSLL